MTEDLDTIWPSLIKEVNSSRHEKSLLLRRLQGIGLHIGIDLSSGQRIVVLEIRSSDSININEFPKWSGIELFIRGLDDNREAIVLRLVDKEGTIIFDALIKDINNSLADEKNLENALECFKECLNDWSEFFKRYGYSGLGPESQRGLYGELFFLKKYVLANTDIIDGINYWRGHSRKFQDFSFPNGNVEIKTTIKKEHKTVIITSEKQLDDAGLISLYLCCLALNVTEDKGRSLPSIIKDIRQFISTTPNALRLFNKFLQDAGYLDEHEKNYENSGYIVKDEHFFKITEGFPRIIDLPVGVGDIHYTVVLSACKDFEANINEAVKNLLGDD